MRSMVMLTDVIFGYCIIKSVKVQKNFIALRISIFQMIKYIHGYKEPFEVQDRLMDFNVTEFKISIATIANSTFQLTFKKLLFVEF